MPELLESKITRNKRGPVRDSEGREMSVGRSTAAGSQLSDELSKVRPVLVGFLNHSVIALRDGVWLM